MELIELIVKAEARVREESIVYDVIYDNKRLIIKKPVKRAGMVDELNLVRFLDDNRFPAYTLLNDQFENSDDYIIYEFMNGADGFHSARNDEYFNNAGRIIGRMHRLFESYAKQNTSIGTTIVHNDMHSGNILVTSDGLHIIDFSSCVPGDYFIDLLNIEYEITFELDVEAKRKAFLDGYRENMDIPFPDVSVVVKKILDIDEDEYTRILNRGDTATDYFNTLRKSVLAKVPSFIPRWCTDKNYR